MEIKQIYLSEINIRKIRHLKDIKIELSKDQKRHLLLTGVNGCGKTSVLNVLKSSIDIHGWGFAGSTWKQIDLNFSTDQIEIKSNLPSETDGKDTYKLYKEGKLILLYFPADRKLKIDKPKTVEAVDINIAKALTEKMNISFGQLLVYSYMEKLIAIDKGDQEKVREIEEWFDWITNALRKLFDNEQLILEFSLESMCYKIRIPDREPFGLDEMASGYEALFDFFSEIVIRMEHQAHLKYDLPGIVLIDEIELHLHISWQKKVLPFLTDAFPNLQFIVATHSPFVVSSIESAVVYDLEKKIQVEDLSAYSYECLVNSLFDTATYSDVLDQKYKRYLELVEKDERRDLSEDEELVGLIGYFQSVPIFMARDIILDFKDTERQRKHGKDKEIKTPAGNSDQE